jgi:endoglucanase
MVPKRYRIVLALGLAACLLPSVRAADRKRRSDDAILRASWAGFVSAYIGRDGRVRRPEQNDDTVSEGQAYAMLRAVWMDDRPVFERVLAWTRTHLRQEAPGGDGLLAWHWVPEGAAGHVADANFAADADADYAFALILASRRWGRGDAYLQDARRVLAVLLARTTATDRDGVLLWLPGAWAGRQSSPDVVILNPSYFAPAWFRVFHDVTGDARWLRLADSSYMVLRAVCGGAGALPVVPDWIQWTSASNWTMWRERPPVSSWDAVRVPWRVGTDQLWFHTPTATAFIGACLAPLAARAPSALGVELASDGAVIGAPDHPLANAMYSFAREPTAERDRLLDHISQQARWSGDGSMSFGDGRHYYVDSLAYLPFLARRGRYTP